MNVANISPQTLDTCTNVLHYYVYISGCDLFTCLLSPRTLLIHFVSLLILSALDIFIAYVIKTVERCH